MSNLKVATIVWNENSDVTKIKFTKEFLESSWIVQADVLKDIMYESTEAYTEFLRKEIDKEL
jgi:hypothetical protein